ncbi:hypothetical protein JX265_008040 [Neoarthrinium moseri]|uniref:Uncharacterized protein n=1 Tax=Neoarthrinium moseri TaxID=1658444 RepID=A0A9P9WJ07_9PEZI|nr:hypothetical protein JX265_008040 [Neoarthrinium moseri]
MPDRPHASQTLQGGNSQTGDTNWSGTHIPTAPANFPSQYEVLSQASASLTDASNLEADPKLYVASFGERERGWTIPDMYSTVDENGRTYQGFMPGEYSLPNDGEEQDRQDFQHALYNIILDGKLASAPIRSPKHILDIGTGTGIWAIDAAELWPSAQVIGTDLSLIQAAPRTSNCHFFLENSETQDWVYSSPFDYIHLRSVGPCFTDIRTVFQKAYNHLAPGGWIELQDGAWELYSLNNTSRGSAFERWLALIKVGSLNQGRDMTKIRSHRDYLKQVGFVNIGEKETPVPTSPWAKDRKSKKMGYFLGSSMLSALEPYRKTIGSAGLSPEEIDELAAAVKQELLDLRNHWFMPACVIYAQKPFNQEYGSGGQTHFKQEPGKP